MFQLRNMEQLCSILRVPLNQAAPICNEKKTLIVHSAREYQQSQLGRTSRQERWCDTSQSDHVPHGARKSEIVASKLKSFFVCHLCLFTVDLTFVATPKEKQKNDMLLHVAIILEHLWFFFKTN